MAFRCGEGLQHTLLAMDAATFRFRSTFGAAFAPATCRPELASKRAKSDWSTFGAALRRPELASHKRATCVRNFFRRASPPALGRDLLGSRALQPLHLLARDHQALRLRLGALARRAARGAERFTDRRLRDRVDVDAGFSQRRRGSDDEFFELDSQAYDKDCFCSRYYWR